MGRRRRRGWVDVDAEPGDDSALDLIIDTLTPGRNGHDNG
jgi:hypothetical protein